MKPDPDRPFPTEVRDLIVAVLTLQRKYHEMSGDWLKLEDVEALLRGVKSL